jgi:hypothetical protein
VALTVALLSISYVLAYTFYRLGSGNVKVKEEQRRLYELWVRHNGNSVKKAILVVTALLSAAILSQLFFNGALWEIAALILNQIS